MFSHPGTYVYKTHIWKNTQTKIDAKIIVRIHVGSIKKSEAVWYKRWNQNRWKPIMCQTRSIINFTRKSNFNQFPLNWFSMKIWFWFFFVIQKIFHLRISFTNLNIKNKYYNVCARMYGGCRGWKRKNHFLLR